MTTSLSKRTKLSVLLASCVLVTAFGCTGHIGSTAALSGIEGQSQDGVDGGGTYGDGDGNTSGGKSGGSGAASAKATAFPLSRMTSVQYQNTLRDLFAPISVPVQNVPTDVLVESFSNNTSAQTPSPALIDAYHTGAKNVSTEAMKSAAQLLGCTPSGRSDEDACAAKFFETFGRKAYRRPVTNDEIARLQTLYTSLRDDDADFATAMTLCLQAMLQSPGFLYRAEIGAPIAGRTDAVKLLPYELASRLSYLLWNTMPDEELLDAAEAGDLDDKSGIEKHARRMLADPRAHDAVMHFHSEWLRFAKMNDIKKDPTLFPEFNDDTAKSLRASAEKYVENIFFEKESSLEKLLTDDHAWVNDDIANIYDVPSPGPELALVAVDPKQRSGILTHAGLMAGFAHETANSPVLRGVFVLNSIMCTPLPPPPPNVNATPPGPDSDKPMTTRQRFETQHEQGACATCHHTIDGIGFGFEHYDAVGKWRTKDMGLPVDASGWFADNAGDLASGKFDGAVDLGAKLAGSSLVHTCVAANWLRYALGVDHTGIDTKGLRPIVDAFTDSKLNMRELVIALTTSDAFTTRVVEP